MCFDFRPQNLELHLGRKKIIWQWLSYSVLAPTSFVTLEEAAKPGRKGSVFGPTGRGNRKIRSAAAWTGWRKVFTRCLGRGLKKEAVPVRCRCAWGRECGGVWHIEVENQTKWKFSRSL